MNDLRPVGTPINLDGVEREILFTLPAIHEIQKKFGESIDAIMDSAMGSSMTTCEVMEWERDMLTILFNDESKRKKEIDLEITKESLEEVLTAKTAYKVLFLILSTYGYDLPQPDDDEDENPNMESGEQK